MICIDCGKERDETKEGYFMGDGYYFCNIDCFVGFMKKGYLKDRQILAEKILKEFKIKDD